MAISYGPKFTPIWKTFGGTGYASFGTNVSDNTMFGNKRTYNNSSIVPYDRSGEMGSQINENLYNYWANKKNTMWYKRIRSYNSSGLYTGNSAIHADVFLRFTGDATMEKVRQALNGGYTDLGGYVYMSFYLGTARTFYDYGRTKYAYSASTASIGFANNTDSGVPSGQEVMGNNISIHSTAGWEARHVISYNSDATGRDVTRCQFLCWADITGVAEEIVWYAGDCA